ncbi:MAG: lipoate--protein ligase [Thermacetogeniaceae bacterium]
MKTSLAIATSTDPWLNMAVEEYLFNHVSSDEMILYLWQVQNTVMIGKHQNPLKECRCEQLEHEGGKLGRRLSGGGAVFQDLGTLMFSFISDRDLYNLDRQLQTILQAVNYFGINAEFSGRNDLTAQGKKFSGNAFYFKGRASLHHGTLLVNADLTRLARYLTVSREKISSKGVDSVQSRVVNLSTLSGDITIEAISQRLQVSFSTFYGRAVAIGDLPRNAEIARLYQKHSSWEWRYGHTPAFDIAFNNRFLWGDIDINLSIRDGLITNAVVYSDAMDCDLAEIVASALQHIPFRKETMIDRIKNCSATGDQQVLIEDIGRWLEPKLT